MEFFNSAIEVLKVLVMALGAGLAVWGVVNLLEGYGSDNPAANSQGGKQSLPTGVGAMFRKAKLSSFSPRCFELCSKLAGR